MKLPRRNLCILVLVIEVTIYHTNASAESKQESSKTGDSETELLDKEYGVRYADACEELEERFHKLGQTSEVIETGYNIDGPKKRTKYTKSELYFIESLEGVCDELLHYKIHKERTDSNRIAKGMPSTFETLHKLADKGVKVNLGMPRELWDAPSAEITALKQQCEDYIEKYDDLIEQWYWGDRTQPLQQYICRERILTKNQLYCLDDPPAPKPTDYVPKSTSDEETKFEENREEL